MNAFCWIRKLLFNFNATIFYFSSHFFFLFCSFCARSIHSLIVAAWQWSVATVCILIFFVLTFFSAFISCHHLMAFFKGVRSRSLAHANRKKNTIQFCHSHYVFVCDCVHSKMQWLSKWSLNRWKHSRTSSLWYLYRWIDNCPDAITEVPKMSTNEWACVRSKLSEPQTQSDKMSQTRRHSDALSLCRKCENAIDKRHQATTIGVKQFRKWWNVRLAIQLLPFLCRFLFSYFFRLSLRRSTTKLSFRGIFSHRFLDLLFLVRHFSIHCVRSDVCVWACRRHRTSF